mmetsp:Transcript_16381/g.20956  ORF Transcript_16381/g.20956 Transcript_16381/m.20956 type:complete len:289 (-) Transcript_16381:119-985(-)
MDSAQLCISALGTVVVVFGSLWVFKKVFASQVVTLPAPTRPKYVIPVIDCSRASLEEDMENTRARPIVKLPISVDLPRLARKTIIYDGDSLLFDGTDPANEHLGSNEAENRTKLIQGVWSSVAKLVDEERECIGDLCDALRGGDVAAQLGNFMGNNYTDDSRVIRILKVCNQSLLAPTVVRMKESIGIKYPYKDQRGQWIIVIRKEHENITVTHTKKEQSWESLSDFALQHFEYTWSLRIELDITGENLLSVTVTIDDIQFEDTVPHETRNKIVACFNAVEFIEPVQL